MHGKTETDNIFTVRKPAWHGLAEVWPDYPTRKEAQRFAHPWEPIPEPVYQKVIGFNEQPDGLGGTVQVPVEEYRKVDGFNLNVRSDNADPLGVVTSTYELVRNGEMYDIADAIESGDPASVRYETGGSLHGGRKVWLLLRLAVPLVVRGDPHGHTIPYYALQNDHGGMGSFRGQATMTRIICDNTAQMADMDAQARGTEFVFRHTRNVLERITQAQTALAGWRNSVREYQLLCDHLVDLKVTSSQRDLFIDEFIPSPPPHMASERVLSNVKDARSIMQAILAGKTCEGIENTAYGLVQASIEYAEHYRRANTPESRFKRAYLDRSRITADAVTIAREVVNA